MLAAPNVVHSLVLFALLGVLQASLGPLIPVVAARHHLGAATAGLLISVFFIGSLVSILAGSALGERRMGTRLVVLLILMIAAGALGLVFAPGWSGQLAAVTVAGLGFGLLTLIVNADMASRPHHGVALANLVNAAFAVGAALGPTLIGLTLHLRYSWSLVAVAIALIATAPLRTSHPPSSEASQPQPEATAEPVKSPQHMLARSLILFCLLLFFYPVLETGLSTWETAYLHATGYSTQTAAMLTSLFWVGLATGRFAIPLLSARWSPARIILLAFAVAIVALGLISLPALAAVGFLLGGIASGPIKPSALAWIAHNSSQPRRMDGYAMASAMLGNITLPAAFGYVMAATTERLLPALVAIAVAASIAITLTLRVTLTRSATTHEQH